MNLAFRRLLSLLLVIILCVSLVPAAFAAETETQPTSEVETEPITEPTTEAPNPTEESLPHETSPPTEETIPQDTKMDSYGIAAAAEDYGIMTVASSKLSNVTLLDLASPYNYTIMLPSQVSVQYKPNGTGSSKTAYLKNIAWHYYSYGGTGYRDDPLYCIEPYKNYAASTPGNYADQGVDVYGSNTSGSTGSSVWYGMPSSYRKAIAYILQCSEMRWDYSVSAASVSKDNNPNFPLRTATQILIYEIVMGLRNPDTFYLNSSNGYEDGDILYNAFVNQVSGFSECYHSIVSDVQSASLIPSFCSSSSSSAPTINLAEDSVLTWVHDDNEVMNNFTFTEDDRIYFNVYGSDLCIENYGDFSGTKTYSCYRAGPSASSSTFNIFYPADSSYQTCVNLLSPATSYTYGYFKLHAEDPTGSLNIAKSTEDGKNLSGWPFALYYDAACTSLAAGPYTTNSSGKIVITGITAGSYYVKELSHGTSSINSQYACASVNPQRVTITSGSTASVSFYNKLNTGSVKLIKETNTGNNRSGWPIGLYTNAACTTAVNGSPYTTGADGTITVSGLKPGTYYAKEIPNGDSYWVCDTSVKTVKVIANQTSSVTFTNTHYGRIAVQKSTNTGNHLSGWPFQIRNAEGDVVAELVTDEKGYAVTGNLPLGRYIIQELPSDDLYWKVELGFHDITVTAGETVVDEWLNVEQGLAWFYKITNTPETAEGWEITLFSDEACTQKVTTIVTNEEGKAGIYLDPGIYYAKETGDTHGRFENEYWLVDETVHKVEVKPHEDTSVTFTNIQYGKLKVTKTMDSEGSAEGWPFKITDFNGDEIPGSPFTTASDGTILTENLLPGEYTIEEIIPEDSLYYCKSENPQTVTVVQGQVAEVSFTNAIHAAKIVVTKVDVGNNPLAGAKFLLEWSEDGSAWEKVVYSSEDTVTKGGCNNPNVVDGCLVSGSDGIMEWDNLHPGVQYRLTELEAPEGYVLLEDYAYEGMIPTRDYTLKLRVINCHGFTLPDTGSNDLELIQLFAVLAMTMCIALPVYGRRRKEM